MPAVRMYIDKFDKEVLIDEDHPLAVAQREGGQGAPSAGKGPVNYARMNVAALTALAKERGVGVPDASSKKELIALLEAADAADSQ